MKKQIHDFSMDLVGCADLDLTNCKYYSWKKAETQKALQELEDIIDKSFQPSLFETLPAYLTNNRLAKLMRSFIDRRQKATQALSRYANLMDEMEGDAMGYAYNQGLKDGYRLTQEMKSWAMTSDTGKVNVN